MRLGIAEGMSLLVLLLAVAGCDGGVGARGGAPNDAGVDARPGRDATAGDDSGAPGIDAGSAADAGSDAAGEPDAGDPSHYVLDDGLRGQTAGNPVGGSLGDDGWTVTARTDRLWYALPRLVEGSIEFTVSNVTLDNLVVADNELFAMYEAGYGIAEPINYNPEIRENHYKCILRVYGQEEGDRVGAQKLMWGMCPSGDPGYGACGCGEFFEEPFGGDPTWDGSPVRIRVEWGGGWTRLYKNGGESVAIDWSGSGLSFGPESLHFSLGTARASAVDGAALPIGAVFSDLHVEGTIGELATCP